MNQNIKEELNNIVDKVCNANYDMKNSYKNYMEKVDKIASYFSSDKAKSIKEAEKEKLYYLLGNKILHIIKEYNEITAETLLFTLYDVVSRLEEQENARVNSKEYMNSLSLNARKEYARLMNYSSEEIEF